MNVSEIVSILAEYQITLTEKEIEKIPEKGISLSEKVRLGSIRY